MNAVILSKEFATGMEKMFVRDPADSRQIYGMSGKKDHCCPEPRGGL